MTKTETKSIGTYKIDHRFKDVVLCENRSEYQRTRKSVLKRPVRRNRANYILIVLKTLAFLLFTKKGLKISCTLVLISWALSTIQISDKPFNPEIKAGAAAPVQLDSKGFESADMPAYTDLFDQYFGSEANIARAICTSESGLKNSINKTLNKDGSWDIGWCQINLKWNWDKIPGETRQAKIDNLMIPEVNVSVAKKVYDSQGFYAWTDYKNNRYKSHL